MAVRVLKAAQNQFARSGVMPSVDSTGAGTISSLRVSVLPADINAGKVLFQPLLGIRYRLVEVVLIATGAAVSGSTAVIITGTQAAAVVTLVSVPIAALARSAVVREDTATVVVLADGASFKELDANTGISIGKTGGTFAGATTLDVIISVAAVQ